MTPILGNMGILLHVQLVGPHLSWSRRCLASLVRGGMGGADLARPPHSPGPGRGSAVRARGCLKLRVLGRGGGGARGTTVIES